MKKMKKQIITGLCAASLLAGIGINQLSRSHTEVPNLETYEIQPSMIEKHIYLKKGETAIIHYHLSTSDNHIDIPIRYEGLLDNKDYIEIYLGTSNSVFPLKLGASYPILNFGISSDLEDTKGGKLSLLETIANGEDSDAILHISLYIPKK